MFNNNVFPRSKLHEVSLVTHVDYPSTFFYPLMQGCKKDSTLDVKINQALSSGEILARSKKRGSQNLHSAVGGVVKSVRRFRYSGNYDYTKAVEVSFGGHFSTFKELPNASVESLKIDTIISRIAYAGIFDLDLGPIESLLVDLRTRGITKIVVNALECSPFLLLEEKILQLHGVEIIKALMTLLRILGDGKDASDTKSGIQTIVCSNQSANARQIKKLAMQYMGTKDALSTKAVSLAVDDESLITKNHMFVFKKLFETETGKGKLETQANLSNTLVIRPSTLLAIYEAVFCKKPYIEKYVQVIFSAKDSLVIKVPIGMPLCYLIMQLSQYISGQVEHFFMETFIHREILFDFTTPVSKHFSHVFMLTDKSFSAMYALLSKHSISRYHTHKYDEPY